MKNIEIKIDRAKVHFLDMQKKIEEFFQSNPYQVDIKRNEEKRPIHYVSKIQEVPIEIPLLAGEVIHNLRSALDYVAYRLFIINTPEGDGKHIYFPISDDSVKYAFEKVKKTNGLSQPAKDLIDSFNPYKGGNDVLWQIHRLNNIDKHRLLVTVGSSFKSIDMGGFGLRKHFPDIAATVEIPPLFFNAGDNLFPLKEGDELFIDLPDAEGDKQMKFKFNLVLHESGIIEGENIVEVLNKMIAETVSIISDFAVLIV